MAPESMPVGECSKHAIERHGPGPSRNINFREATMHASSVIISLVQEAAALAPCAELKQAAAIALIIFETIQAVKDNKEAYKRLGDDSAGLIAAIWRSFKKAESPNEWLSADMQEILVELTHTLNHICSFVREKLARNKAIRFIYSKADVGKIAEYRENLNSAMQKFELQSHMNIDLKLGKLLEQIRYRNVEDMKRFLEITAREARDLEEAERTREQELKTAKKISTLEHLKQLEIDYKAEVERDSKKLKGKKGILSAAHATVMANRLKKAEGQMVELKQKIAAGRRLGSTMSQAQPSKNKRSSSQDPPPETIHEQEPKVVKKISTLEHLKQLEIDYKAEEEREHSEKLKGEKGLKKAEEGEMVELRRKIPAARRRLGGTMPHAQRSKNKREFYTGRLGQRQEDSDWRYGWGTVRT